MGIKVLPSQQDYWKRPEPFLYCPIISQVMSRGRFESIGRCLHVVKDDDDDPDKLQKMKVLIQEIVKRYEENWNLHKEVSIDKMMVPYKDKFCSIRQYLPSKPTKWGIKVWCLAGAITKYVYHFEVYTRSNLKQSLRGAKAGEAKTNYEVVYNIMKGLYGLDYLVVFDNFFISIKLLVDLLKQGTFDTRIIHANRGGLSKCLSNKKLFIKEPLGIIAWRLHESRKISCVTWVDCKPVLLLSTHNTVLTKSGIFI